MKTTTGQKLKIGIFTAIGIAILFAAVFLIGSQKNLFSSTYRVHGIFKNVSGLQVGNNVRLAGINVGVVEAITILTDTSVRVDLTINSNYQKFVKKDARLSIGTDGFIGDKLVTIAPGGATTTEAAKPEQELASIPPFDTDRLIAKGSKIVDNLGDLSGDLSQIVAKVNNGQGSLGRLLNNDKMAKDMENTVSAAKNTMTSVKATTGTLNEDLKAAQNNFLLKGFFKKKQAAAKAKQDSINKANGIVDTTAKKKKRGFLGLGKKS